MFQASEKALKAAQFSVDAVAGYSHDLCDLAATIEDADLKRLALRLQALIGDHNKLYNPGKCLQPNTSNQTATR